MREILFRGKTVCDGDWIYGGITWNPSRKKMFIHSDFEDGEVIPKTVGQYTGLTDKNGTKIFEGDIVKIIDGKEIFIAAVKFGDYNQPDKILKTHIGFYFDIANLASYRKDMGYWFGKTFSEIEVIGNIHDNPELLEVNQNG